MLLLLAAGSFYFVSNAFNSLLPQPPIEVSIKIDKSTINVNDYATLTVSITNKDLKTHEIVLTFSANERVSFFAGTESELNNNQYQLTLDATQPTDTRVFTVRGTLADQMPDGTYAIALGVTVDGNNLQKTWDDCNLKVTA